MYKCAYKENTKCKHKVYTVQKLTDYQLGYKAYGTVEGNKEYEDHFSGVKRSQKNDEWFNGFHDALDDSKPDMFDEDEGDY